MLLGQIAVALGRATSTENIHLINFQFPDKHPGLHIFCTYLIGTLIQINYSLVD